MPRGARGRPENERPGRSTVDDALTWLSKARGSGGRLFLWVHLFEPHAPYGQSGSGRSVADRYDDEIAESDVQVGRLLEALGADAPLSLIVVASDHGEAFGEHGEVSHSLFVYDTTLRVPLIIAGPGVPARTVASPVSLIDIAPTVLPLLGVAGVRQRRHQSRAGHRRRQSPGTRPLRRIVRSAPRLRLESAPGAAVAGLQVHRGAAARALRPPK